MSVLLATRKFGLAVMLGMVALGCCAPAWSEADNDAADKLQRGRRIYMEGVLSSGALLTGTRLDNTVVSGADVACVKCHRRSGMGAVEGDIQIPPITGSFLFGTEGDRQLATMDPRVSKRFNQAHDPYTDETLAEAIRHGKNNRGREMNMLMPRYNLSEADQTALTAYLHQLSAQWSPGVTEDTIRFATVVTPEVDPQRRKVWMDMMRIAFNQKNGSTMTARRSGGKRQHMVSAAEMVLGTERNWQLDIWELQGAPDTWAAQLVEHYRSQPVFALASGLSGATWQPVHDFCERERVPCWFPNVLLPDISQSPYSLYFSRGLSLEADVLAQYLSGQKLPQRIVQVYRDNDLGRAVAQSLARALSDTKVAVEDRPLQDEGDITEALRKVLSNVRNNDGVMLWLRADDVALLEKIKPIPGAKIYFSAGLADADHIPLPTAWGVNAYMIYPYELPEKRASNLAYFRAWLNMRKLPLVDEVMQSQTFFALNFLTDTVAEMLNNLYRDYLLERAESMLSKREGGKAEQETRDRLALGREGELARKYGAMTVDAGERVQIAAQLDSASKSVGTTIYPRLSLGTGQRFASKGGYIVRFSPGENGKLLPESTWIVP
jgi:cytochrome c553